MEHFALEALGEWGSQAGLGLCSGGPGGVNTQGRLGGKGQGPQACRLEYSGLQEPLGALKDLKEALGMHATPDSI